MKERIPEIILVGLLAVAFLLLGLAVYDVVKSSKLKEGVVIEKTHHDAWAGTEFDVVMKLPKTVFHPEEWRIVIMGEAQDGEHLKRHVRLTHDVWETVKVGDFYRVK